MKILIGNTGLVGTTLQETIKFDYLFNSKNIHTFIDHNFNDCDLYLSCLPATKWMVNKDVVSDLNNINDIIKILSKFNYNRIILISTIDVYNDSPINVNEDYNPNFSNLSYGSNRLLFEKFIMNYLSYRDLKIFRLPALFNKHIKKNVIYDLINDNNVNLINPNSKYQWYNLDDLSYDIKKLIGDHPHELVFNLFTEPLKTSDIIDLFPNHKEKIKYDQKEMIYDFKTKHTKTGYMVKKNDVLNQIKSFINEFVGK
jgi:nucleoside-diphosphate-sugar epimerase